MISFKGARVRGSSLFFTFLVSHFCWASTAPFNSKEEVDFLSKQNNELVSLTKTASFQGLITRLNERNGDLQSAEFYRFAPPTSSKVGERVCQDWLAKIFGPLKGNTLNVTYVGVFGSGTNQACEAVVTDPKDQKSKIPERRVILGFLKDQPAAIVFKLSKKSDAVVQENIRSFWQGLR